MKLLRPSPALTSTPVSSLARFKAFCQSELFSGITQALQIFTIDLFFSRESMVFTVLGSVHFLRARDLVLALRNNDLRQWPRMDATWLGVAGQQKRGVWPIEVRERPIEVREK